MSRVLVTGAAGFIGRALVPRLVERGHAVRAAVRRADSAPPPALPAGVETVAVGTVGPDTDWRAALDGVTQVVHLAGRVHVLDERAVDPLAAFRRVNVEGTRRLAVQAAEAGVRRLLFLSSVKALAEDSAEVPLAAGAPPCPGSPYGLSKLEAEEALMAAAAAPAAMEAAAMEVVVLRPHLVYGPGVGANFARLLDLCWTGVPLPLAGIRNHRGILFLGNLVDAIAHALEHPAAAGRRFALHDGAPLSTPDLLRRISAALERPSRLVHLPPELLRLGATLAGRQEVFRRLGGSLVVDDGAFRRDLGWSNPYTTDEGLRLTAEWYRRHRRGG